MADEITIRSSVQIRKGNLEYRPHPAYFQADMSGTPDGPSPGALAVAVTGTNVSFSQITTPAVCRITNLDATNFVEVGIWDGLNWYPILEILAGESYIVRLSRNLSSEYGTGTGTSSTDVNQLQLRANTAACNVIVEAFPA